ncbi:MAG: DNA polymerase IV [Nocardioidaceae bacterium]
MRGDATILHLDLDAFFAAVEQRDKPSLRGKPVVVGGVGRRGVVATASYEARQYGVRSAMSTSEARSRCPHAAFLSPRFDAYRRESDVVMTRLRKLSELVEPLSVDEAFVDLAAATPPPGTELEGLDAVATSLRAEIAERTGGLTASIGIATSKLVAKIASELAKPDGQRVVAPGTEQDLLRPMQATVIPGVGPATAERLRRIGVHTVAELETISQEELTRVLGTAHGHALDRLARAQDDRPVVAERETKSVSIEDTFDTDLVDRAVLTAIVTRMAGRVAERLTKAGLSGRTITLKVRHHDFSTNTRSTTLAGPTADARTISRLASGLLAELDTTAGVRLLGVGVSGLADWIQEDLFTDEPDDVDADPEPADTPPAQPPSERAWPPGSDVLHDQWGLGWVWGSGRGHVTVRFETQDRPDGPVRTFAVDDPMLHRADLDGRIRSST